MKGYYFYLCLVLLAFPITSCIQLVEIKPPEKSEVVLKCILMNDTLQRAVLYYSGALGDTTFTPVDDAEIIVTTKNGSEYLFSYEGNGCYICDFQPFPGREYFLKVFIPGRDTITARTVFPKKFEMGSMFFPPEEWVAEGMSVRKEKGWFVYNELYPWNFSILGIEEMQKENGFSIPGQMPGLLFFVQESYPKVMYILGFNELYGKKERVTNLTTNHKYVDPSNMNKSVFHVGDTVSFETDMKAWFNQKVSSRYDGLPMYDDYLRIASPEKYDNGLGELYSLVYFGSAAAGLKIDASPYFFIAGELFYNYWSSDANEKSSSLFFCSVSDDYDQYLQDCRHQMMATDGDLLATLYSDASRIYTNINGGLGIFGGMYVLRHDCNLKLIPAGEKIEYVYPFDLFLPYSPYPSALPEI